MKATFLPIQYLIFSKEHIKYHGHDEQNSFPESSLVFFSCSNINCREAVFATQKCLWHADKKKKMEPVMSVNERSCLAFL